MSILVVSFVGYSSSGKTTILSKVISELTARGYKIATIKHAEEINLEPGKDSSRHLAAGSRLTAVVTPDEIVIIRPTAKPATINEVISLIGSDFDIILGEGYKNADIPKIEVHHGPKSTLLKGINGLVAVITDKPLNTKLQQFLYEDIRGIADFIENNYIRKQDNTIDIFINGKAVDLTLFPAQVVSQTIISLLSNLKNVGDCRDVKIELKGQIKPVETWLKPSNGNKSCSR